MERLWGHVIKGSPVSVTGHSKGGAEAILAAHILKTRGWNIVECVAFAAPRTGTRKLLVPTTIYDHYDDPVCEVPWLWEHPIDRLVLPDMSDGMLQHSMDYYVRALELRDG